jgi:hypothetical protein
LEARIRAAMASGHLPDHDTRLAAAALVGSLLEGLLGPLAPETVEGDAGRRAAVQGLSLLCLRAVGVPDARARGVVVQTALPAD